MTDKSIDSDCKELLFEKGIALRDQGNYEGACEVFTRFIQKYPNEFAGYLLKGGILLISLHLIDEALVCFRKALALNPKSELASVGLFQCLWRKNLTDEAFEEMKRYVRVAGRSEEYARILDEMDESFGWRDKE